MRTRFRVPIRVRHSHMASRFLRDPTLTILDAGRPRADRDRYAGGSASTPGDATSRASGLLVLAAG